MRRMDPFFIKRRSRACLTEEENWARPVLATINNHPLARPQSGISQADVVYEFMAEGNVTRFLALFQSELPETVGPIRSARDYFIHLVKRDGCILRSTRL